MSNRYCAIYLRVSTGEQKTESQERAILNHLEQKGISDYRIFSDQGQSGSKNSRPALDEMLREVRLGNIHTVVTFSISRLGRNVRHLLEVVEVFKKHDTVFISITERIDDSPIGKLLLAILGALSELELDAIRSRIKSGLDNARAKGIQLGRKKHINDKLVIELHSQGYKQNKISELLKCSPSTISKIIKMNNPKQ